MEKKEIVATYGVKYNGVIYITSGNPFIDKKFDVKRMIHVDNPEVFQGTLDHGLFTQFHGLVSFFKHIHCDEYHQHTKPTCFTAEVMINSNYFPSPSQVLTAEEEPEEALWNTDKEKCCPDNFCCKCSEIDPLVTKALDDAFVAGRSKQSFEKFKLEWIDKNKPQKVKSIEEYRKILLMPNPPKSSITAKQIIDKWLGNNIVEAMQEYSTLQTQQLQNRVNELEEQLSVMPTRKHQIVSEVVELREQVKQARNESYKKTIKLAESISFNTEDQAGNKFIAVNLDELIEKITSTSKL